MHDPDTIIWSMSWPFRLTLMHHDPQVGGSDDSCGYLTPRLTKNQLDNIKFFGQQEAKHPWFQKCCWKEITDAKEAESLIRGALFYIANALNIKLSVNEATKISIKLIHNQVDNVRSSLAFLPGYHSNNELDNVEDREYHATQFFIILARNLLRRNRPWWKHPKFHFWHWKIRFY